MKKFTSARVEEGDIQKMKAAAESLNVSASEVTRWAIARWLYDFNRGVIGTGEKSYKLRTDLDLLLEVDRQEEETDE